MSQSLRCQMDALGLNTGDVALISGTTRRSVQLWLAGSSPAPRSVTMLLAAICGGLISLEWVEDQIITAVKAQNGDA
jgi:hypothetical protein